MKIVSAVLVLLAAASSFGAVVTFNNPSVPVGTPSVGLTVAITPANNATFSAVDVIMQSATLNLAGTWAPAVTWDAPVDNGNLGITGAANERWVGGAMTSVSKALAAGTVIGTLTIPTASLPQGVYTLKVDGAADGLSAAGLTSGATDTLTGNGTVTITPEPVSLALLALGGLLVARRRHA